MKFRIYSIAFSLYCAVVAAIAVVLLVQNLRLYTSVRPAMPGVLQQLAHLRKELDEGAAKDMQQMFPEGAVFTYAMYGLACAETAGALPDTSAMRKQWTAEARCAFVAIESPEARRIFSADLSPPHGIFYTGWSAFLCGSILKSTPVAEWATRDTAYFLGACANIERALRTNSSLWLQSYYGAAWPADNTVAIAALRLHDKLFPPRYKLLIDNWLHAVRQKLDTTTGLIPHSADAFTGAMQESPRGSSQSLVIRLLTEIDPAFAREQYVLFRRQFAGSVCGLPAIREYPAGYSGAGDIDSGPVVFGIGSSATIVGLGTALAVGDNELAEPVEQTIEALGIPLSVGGQKFYAGGALPVADAFLVWSKSAHLRVATPLALPPAVPHWWRLPAHTISLCSLVFLCAPMYFVRRRNKVNHGEHREKV